MWRYNYVNTTELYHYGIPGMKWGQRIASKWNDHFDKRRVKLEEKYRKQGMSKKDAQAKAEKTVKGEQITTGVASAVGTAALGYAAYRLLRGPKSKSNTKTNLKVTNGPITMNTLTEKINSKAGKKVPTYTPIKINKKTAIKDLTKANQDYLKDGPYRVSSMLGTGWSTGDPKKITKGGPGRPKGSKNKPKNTLSNIPEAPIASGAEFLKSIVTLPNGSVFESLIGKKK